MSERHEFSPVQKIGFGLATLGLTTGGIALANGAPAEAHTVHIAGTNAKLPKDVKEIMNDDTVYMNTIGCSGSLIRNAKDQPIGVLTAEHCFDTYDTLTTGTNGKEYFQVYSTEDAIPVQSGVNTFDGVKTIGYVNNVEISKDPYLNHDLAIGAFVGRSLTNVVKTYEKTALSASAVEKLKPGTVVYDSGYPAYQPENDNGESDDRQDLEMHVIGIKDEDGTPMLVTDVKKSDDGAVCSPGISGSELFTVDKDGVKHPIAAASIYWDLTGAISGAPMSPGFKYPKNTDGVCGFSFEQPDKNSIDLHVVNNTDSIPGYVDDTTATANAEIDLNSPTVEKTMVDGVLSTDKGGLVENPILVHLDNNGVNPETVIFYDTEDKVGNTILDSTIITDQEMVEGLEIYPDDAGADIPQLINTTEASGMGNQVYDPTPYFNDPNSFILDLVNKGEGPASYYVYNDGAEG